MKKTIIILIGVLVVIIAVTWIIFQSPEEVEELEETIPEEETITEEEMVVEEPEEKIIEENETKDWEAYRNEEYGYKISYPLDWIQKDRTVMSDLGHLDYFWIKRNSNQLSVDVWDTSIYSYEELKQPPPGGIDMNTIEKENIEIENYLAVKFTYNSVSDVYGEILTQKVSIFKDNIIYLIECFGQECNQIISTFSFLD